MSERLQQVLFELICRASFELPADVEDGLRQARAREEKGGGAERALTVILDNVESAAADRLPLCQDTGSLLFRVEAPVGLSYAVFAAAAESAVRRATEAGMLRPNCVDALTGRNSGTNLGRGMPAIEWHGHPEDRLQVSLILKGGGCENVGRQYALPDLELSADRNLEGVRKCCLDAVWRAQGGGCSPGVLGVCIGGDRASGYQESKRQFLRSLGVRSPVAELAELEERILREANQLGVGPMGFGGNSTLLDVFVGRLDRLPASYFVTVSYMCWAFRRREVILSWPELRLLEK